MKRRTSSTDYQKAQGPWVVGGLYKDQALTECKRTRGGAPSDSPHIFRSDKSDNKQLVKLKYNAPKQSDEGVPMPAHTVNGDDPLATTSIDYLTNGGAELEKAI
ncbi:hypothetical protein F5Y19DRAFT_481994 [Xylariaceae sp. FL1651]|nr:hypothetical protein F5Y19DRAFT_481994 [Xylariaceae sp. FL1651]